LSLLQPGPPIIVIYVARTSAASVVAAILSLIRRGWSVNAARKPRC
jgi:hypothetical protein